MPEGSGLRRALAVHSSDSQAPLALSARTRSSTFSTRHSAKMAVSRATHDRFVVAERLARHGVERLREQARLLVRPHVRGDDDRNERRSGGHNSFSMQMLPGLSLYSPYGEMPPYPDVR